MWWRVELKNFRSIEHATVELAPFTVLVGPNGSGKSNFADALVFARDVAIDASTAVAKRGGISAVRRWGSSVVGVDVRVASARDELDSDYVRHFFEITCDADGKWRFEREIIEIAERGAVTTSLTRAGTHADVFHGVLGAEPASLHFPETTSAMVYARQATTLARLDRPAFDARRIRLNPEEMRKPQVISENDRLEESGANIAVSLARCFRLPARKAAVEDVMHRIIPGLTGIGVVPLGRFMTLEFEQRHRTGTTRLGPSEMSEGALRALGIVIAAQQLGRGELLVVEEPEAHVHPGAAAVLFEVLKEASDRGTILVTTHSPELLEAARDEEILVCDLRTGTTHIGPLSSGQREAVREGLFSVAELMRSEPLRIEGEPPAAVDLTP